MSGEIVKQDTKSWSQMFVDRAKQEIANAPPAPLASYVKESGSTFAEYAEGGVTGSLLGATHAQFGLDTRAGPVDGWLAAFGAIFGVAASGHFPALAARARGVGAKAFTVLSFRKSYELVKHEPLGATTTARVQRVSLPGKGPGVAGEDPIEAAARALG
jgi:hypothetical protein